MAVASGMADVALVVGVEKFTDKIGPDVTPRWLRPPIPILKRAGPYDNRPGCFNMKRYMHEYDVPPDGFAGFALTAHANGAGNKFAMYRKAIKPETYSKAEMVSEPLNMFDIAPTADGAGRGRSNAPRSAARGFFTSSCKDRRLCRGCRHVCSP